MKIECTKEEFRTLVDLVYAGNILINGLKSQEERIKVYSDMEQTLFALAESFGLGDIAEYSEEFKEYMPTHAYEEDEEGVNPYIDLYDEKIFWEELTLRLARRDVLNEVGDVNPDMTKQEVSKKQLELEEMYEDEFIDNGIARLKLQKQEESLI